MKRLSLVFFIAILFCTNICIGQTNPAIAPYIAYLKEQHQTAKEYILDLFKTHDIVVICERDHRELTQYDLFMDIIRDKRFIEKVGNVFTEVGTSSLNPALNNFLHKKNLSTLQQQRQILSFDRNLTWGVVWEKYNYPYFLQNLYALNNRLPSKKAINLYPSDLPIDWGKMDSANYLKTLKPLLIRRDSIMAAQIIAQFDMISRTNSKRKKALVIMNYRHAFPDIYIGKHKVKNTTGYLFEHYGKRVANVFLYGLGLDMKGDEVLLQDGKWDAAFNTTGNKSIGFDFKDTPFGKDSFDLWVYKNPYHYQDMFTGFVFYLPIENQKLVTGIPGFIDSSFVDEFLRRFQFGNPEKPDTKHFTPEEIASLKKDISGMQKEFNEKREMQYENLNDLIKTRGQWLK